MNPFGGDKCGCGQYGCAEIYASARGTGNMLSSTLGAKNGPKEHNKLYTSKDCFEMAKEGKEEAIEVLQTVCGGTM